MTNGMLRVIALIAALGAAPLALAQSNDQGQGMPGPGIMWGSPWMQQSGPGGMMGSGHGMMGACPLGQTMGGQMMGGQNFHHSASAWLDGQFAYAHSELGITAAQEPAWKAYTDAVRAHSEQMIAAHQGMMSSMSEGDLPFEKAYDFHIDMMTLHLESMKATRDAATKLYDELSAEQQKKASWVLRQSMCMM